MRIIETDGDRVLIETRQPLMRICEISQRHHDRVANALIERGWAPTEKNWVVDHLDHSVSGESGAFKRLVDFPTDLLDHIDWAWLARQEAEDYRIAAGRDPKNGMQVEVMQRWLTLEQVADKYGISMFGSDTWRDEALDALRARETL